MNLVRSGLGWMDREEIPPVPDEVASLMKDVSAVGKLDRMTFRQR
ncbi:hypothetical protein [Nonomuraea basaltis]|nr:hypothetical protein [Nonomuraea basaltis]